jgi:hypothetical protein
MALEVMKMAFILFRIKLIHKMNLSGYRILPFAEKALYSSYYDQKGEVKLVKFIL